MKRAHPLARVLVEGRDIPTILMCVISAVIVAPITEEFLIRLVLQGWLESLERRIRRRVPWLRRIVAGFMPVMMVAVLFAAMHIRWNEPETDLSVVVFGLSVYTVSCVLLVAVSVCWLKFAAGATLADFGIVPSRLASDLRIAAWTLLAFAVPVYAINFDATLVLPKHTVVDPIPLFFLAIALGTLYYRTHRIIPSIALHMAFNAIGVFAAIAMSR
jgi:membrane protease YdiL (CAAX protease family)